MCRWLTPAGWDDWASVLILCKGDYVHHALAWLRVSEAGDPAAEALLSALTQDAKCLLLEQYYFDIDHRSETELVHATQFAPSEVTVDRLHFFSQEWLDGQSIPEYLKAAHTRSLTTRSNETPVYLGYTIIRPRREAKIGRSIVSPWARVEFRSPRDLDGELKQHAFAYHDGEPLPVDVIYDQVRTAVPESVNVYGYDFRAVGVPFMEQDGYILRCAHVSAWICHYSAVLRGLIPRQTTGQIHRAGNGVSSIARPYPSSGVSPLELAAILRSVGLAPEALGKDELAADRDQTWADREELFKRSDGHAAKITGLGEDAKQAAEERERLWICENLTASVCRYLNSGLPVILVRQLIAHTQVVVGYLRASDLGKSDTGAGGDNHSDVVAFLVSDDQEGPFEIVYVDEIVDELISDPLSNELFVPLPEAVWVNGEMAERVGTALIRRITERRIERIDAWLPQAERRKQLESFYYSVQSDIDTNTIRTYVTAGTDLKRSAAVRMAADANMVSALLRLQLPKFVWVCEVIDRALRREGKPSVVATIVLDATQLIHNPMGETPVDDVDPLFVHLPSQFYAPSFQLQTMGYSEYFADDRAVDVGDDGAAIEESFEEPDEDSDDWFWQVTEIGPYFTGRWGQHLLSQLSAATVASFAKGAVRPTS